MSKNILLTNKNPSRLFCLKYELSKFGFNDTLLSNNVNHAIKTIQRCSPDFVIIDLFLRGTQDGIHLAEYLKIVKIPFVFLLSSHNFEAQSYIDDKFGKNLFFYTNEMNKLIKKIENILSSNSNLKENKLDITQIKSKYSLTKNECRCIEILYNKKSLLSHIQLQSELWPNKNRTEATLRSLIRRVRDKFGGNIIENVYGFGYKLNIKGELLC